MISPTLSVVSGVVGAAVAAMAARIFPAWAGLTMGPCWVASSSGSPIFTASSRADSRSRKAGRMPCCTKTRVPFEQTWPEE